MLHRVIYHRKHFSKFIKISLDFRTALWYCYVLQRRCNMVQISLEELYRGEGAGAKHGIMGEVMKDFFTNGYPSEHDERTWLDMLLVKHALIAAEKMKNEGDTVSDVTDDVPPASYVR